MTIPVLFVQGAGEGVHDEWDGRLAMSLARALGPDYAVRYPRMPDEGEPRYAAWKGALLEEFAALVDGAVLVGHSVGGTVLLHLLAEQPPSFRPGAIIAIAAPFIGPGGWPADDFVPRADLGTRLPAGVPVLLYHGTDDTIVPPQHAVLYAGAMPQALLHRLRDRDHQLGDDLSAVARDIRSLAG